MYEWIQRRKLVGGFWEHEKLPSHKKGFAIDSEQNEDATRAICYRHNHVPIEEIMQCNNL